jgi:hypothetical protein
MKLSPLLAAAALAVLSPAAAQAAVGHWSSPVEVLPAAGGAAPRAFVGAGRSLALGADGAKPVLMTGDVAGTIGAPTGIGGDVGPVTALDGALASDGSLVVAWASGGAVHVSTVAPGGAASAPVDLPGAGVNSVAVAIAPDSGEVYVAYRVKESDSSYAVLLASAPKGGAFGSSATLDATSAGVDSLDIAAGANGAYAVSYRKQAPRYKTYVVVRAANAKNFEAAQPLGVSATQSDLDPQVVMDGDGTIVAAWADPEGAMYATRGANDNAWGAAQPLGGPGEAAYSLDLVPTPGGGATAAWAGNGVVKIATQPQTGAFGPATQVDTYGGQIPSDPALTVAPDGTATVVTDHPTEGEIHAIDVGGAAGGELIGYAAAESATPVAVASSSDRTIALWRNAGGGLSAATRSAQAPASQGPGAKPPAPDHVAPKLTFVGASKRLFFRKTPKQISFRVSCSEACTLQADGSLRITVGKKKLVAPLSGFNGKGPVAGTQAVTLKLGPGTRRDLSRALAKRRGAIAYINLTGTDPSSNQGRGKVQLTIKPKPKPRKR